MLIPHHRELCPFSYCGGHSTSMYFEYLTRQGDNDSGEFFYHKNRWYVTGQVYGDTIEKMIDYIEIRRLTGCLDYNTWSKELDDDGSPRVDVNIVSFQRGRVVEESVEVVDY